VTAALVSLYGIRVFAINGEDTETYYKHIDAVIDHRPHLTMDDGADVVSRLHADRPEFLEGIIGGTEETTTGVVRLTSMAADGALRYPIIAVNDARTKHFFDNRYGTGQSTLDGIVRATNRLLAGRTIVISGYGWCGRGLAMRAAGMGMQVIVCEIDALKALEAHMDGYRVMPAVEAAALADIWVTVTGNVNVIDEAAFAQMKDSAIICNSGHFNSEINIPWLEENAVSKVELKPLVVEYTMADGRRIILIAEGRLVNLAAAEGHPAEVMDMSFANQALAAEYMKTNAAELAAGVYPVPDEIDDGIARLKLASLKINIDTLTVEQERYLASWDQGTL
ncbi:MAG: adenosylhomocysteinase, partial [Coriobacteriales bacterium]|nr:adenosylhomocysteinase [Coriobacteriales bacterium]